MKFLTFASALLFTALARAESTTCAENLYQEGYVRADQAVQLCATYPMSTLACAMDIVDSGDTESFYQALNECLRPERED